MAKAEIGISFILDCMTECDSVICRDCPFLEENVRVSLRNNSAKVIVPEINSENIAVRSNGDGYIVNRGVITRIN